MKKFLVCLLCLLALGWRGTAGAAAPLPDLFKAAAHGDRAVLQAALERGTLPGLADRSGKTLLMVAAENGQLELTAYLLFRMAPVDQRDAGGRTALMHACRKGAREVASVLIQAGADVNTTDESGKPVLHYAEQGKDPRLVSLLISCGARPAAKDEMGFAREETSEPFYRVSVHYATNREAIRDAASKEITGFANKPDGASALHYGRCDVAIPKNHLPGELEEPRGYLMQFSSDPSRHVTMLGRPRNLSGEEFFGEIKGLLKKAGSNDVLIFIHGYNVSFTDAARRTAQLSYDLEFKGAPLFFSWPSTESLLGYKTDQERIKATIPLLKEYLRTVSRQFKGANINIIAHSMGTFGFTTALKELMDEVAAVSEPPRFNQIILAAPDINAQVFLKEIAPKIGPAAKRLTLYASSRDLALIVSNFVNNGQRAGDTEPEIVLNPGVDSIDVSRVDTSLLGHSYYGDSSSILTDIRSVIDSENPDRRTFLEARENAKAKRKYWLFNPLKLITKPGPAG